MTPDSIVCPVCHTSNAPTATQCARCATPISTADATLLKNENEVNATPDEKPADVDGTFTGDEGRGDLTDLSGAQGWSRPLSAGSTAAFRAGRLSPHTMLGTRYEIMQLLGEGGMGAVYKAMDREVERMVALKIIRPELAVREDILARFKQELILARRITHKNVIRIFDLGEADGLKFITMEFIEGKDLSSLIREKGRLSFEQCADVMSQTCMALDAAHSEGVVHRDLKPQNIMMDKNGRVIVMDFGIARTVEQGGMTHTGALIGTPDYMSPEQVMGEKVDVRSDLFTLGIIFYQLLVGQLPYKADTIQGAMFKRTRETSASPQSVDPTVPLLLSDITVKCLQLEPQNRYQTAMEIRNDIEAWREGSTKRIELPAPPPPPEPPKIPLWRKPMILVPIAAVALVAGGVLFGGKFLSSPPTKGAPKPVVTAPPVASLAILPFYNASRDPKLDWLGSSMAEMLSTDVGDSSSVRMVSEDRVGQVLKDLRITPQSELDQSTVTRVANHSNVDTIVWGQYAKFDELVRIDVTVLNLKNNEIKRLKAEAANEKDILPTVDKLAAQIRENLSVSESLQKELKASAFKPSTASIAALRDYDKGLQEARQGNHADAITQYKEALHEDENFALAYSKLAQSYAQLGQDDEAEQSANKAVSLSAQLPLREKYLIQASHDSVVKDYPKAIQAYENLVKVSPDNSDYLFDLGIAYEKSSDYAKAEELFKKVVELDPKRIEGLLALGRVEVENGNAQNGIEYLTKARAMAIEVGDDAELAQISQALGVGYFAIPRYDEALKSLNESLEIKTRLGLKKGIAESKDMIATIQDVTGKSNLALKNYTDALSIMRELGDKQGIADVTTDLGVFKLEHGKYDEALSLFKESLRLQTDLHNETSQGMVLMNIGNTYLAKGDFENAGIYFQQSLAVREKLKVPGDIADTLHDLAETSIKTGRFDQAQEQYLRALELRRSSGDQKGAAMESSGLGAVFAAQGRYGAAVSAQQDALKGFQESKEQGLWNTGILLDYGNALALSGRSEEAAKILGDALNSARQQNNQAQIATALSYQADNAFYRGDMKAAASLYAEAQQAATKSGDGQLVLLTKINMAKVGLQQGRFPVALTALRGLGEQADSLGLKELSTKCMVYRGEAMIGMKDFTGAEKELRSALLHSEKLGLRVLQAQSHYQLGRALELEGKASDATTQYQEARRSAADVEKDAQTDAVAKRSDLVPIFALKA
ncbi:MAG TPA: tetratricopeptide repeat protein [Candidatus Acidoferrum sp.]|jgi:serine/threonine protein kinase/Tfp pilus assembly protein PilF